MLLKSKHINKVSENRSPTIPVWIQMTNRITTLIKKYYFRNHVVNKESFNSIVVFKIQHKVITSESTGTAGSTLISFLLKSDI